MSADDRYVPTPTIKQAVQGHEAAVLTALSIQWQGGRPHIRCPYEDHADKHPSWRWDERKSRAYCTCLEDGGDNIFDIVMKIEGCDFATAKLRVAEIIGRADLIGIKGDHPFSAASLLSPPADKRDDSLPVKYLAHRLGVDVSDVPIPATPIAGCSALAYFDAPANGQSKPVLVGEWPCAVFGTVRAGGKKHAHRIYLAPDGQGKADLGTRPDGPKRNPKKSAIGDDTAGCAVVWGRPRRAPHIVLCEGIENGAAIALAFKDEIEAERVAVVAAISALGVEAFQSPPATKHVTVAADRDENKPSSSGGHKRGEKAARRFAQKHHDKIVVDIALPGRPGENADWLDIFRRDGVQAVVSGIESAERFEPTEPSPTSGAWPDPDALPPLTPEVPELPDNLLPEPLRRWLADIAERIQIPLAFAAVPALVALSSLVGRAIGIFPKRKDDWLVVANLWGMLIARPGFLKSPAVNQALVPLKRLVAQAVEKFRDGEAEAEANKEVLKMRLSALQDEGKAASKKGDDAKLADVQSRMTELKRQIREAEAHEHRYIVNDATVEKIGELLNQNPRGLLLVRDELSGLLRSLDKHGREGDREFYLEAWNGDGAFTYDRIGRGTIHIPALTLSIVGAIQPGKLWAYVSGALEGGRGDDGLLQRFQMAVCSDAKAEWRNVDRWPDSAARDVAFDAFKRLDGLDPASLGVVASHDGIPALRFAPDAQELFDAWRADLEARLRTPEMDSCPAFESHLAKYRSLMPSLALIFHLTEFVSSVSSSAVGLESAKRAAAWCEFLEAHARKIYAAELNPDISAAHALAAKIKAGAVLDGGNVRDLYRPQWSGLKTPEAVWEGLMVLQKLGWLRIEERDTGGRKADVVRINPKLKGATP